MPPASMICHRFKVGHHRNEVHHRIRLASKVAAKRAQSLRRAAVINAITDAIGTEDLAMPATAQAVWSALTRTQPRHAA